MALLHWLGRSHPRPETENPQPFMIYVAPSPVPSDTHKMFLTLVYAEVERRWNKTPPFEIKPPNAENKHGGKKYQACCLDVLKWLHAEGDITKSAISSES
jgi:hypothetical protein